MKEVEVEMKESGGRNERSGGERTGHAEAGYTRFFINLGAEKDLQAHNSNWLDK